MQIVLIFVLSCLLRGGDMVAHDLAHLQPYSFNRKLWESDASETIVQRASDDMYAHINSTII